MNKQVFLQRVQSDFNEYQIDPIVYTFKQHNIDENTYYGVIVSNEDNNVMLFIKDSDFEKHMSWYGSDWNHYSGFAVIHNVEKWRSGEEVFQSEVTTDWTIDSIIYGTAEDILLGGCNKSDRDIKAYLDEMYNMFVDLPQDPDELITNDKLHILGNWINSEIISIEFID